MRHRTVSLAQCRLALLLGFALAVSGCASLVEQRPASAASVLDRAPEAEAMLGVRIKALRLSAAGYMLDLRYRVVDADKAAPLLDRKVKPYLLAPNGARLGVPVSPKVGQLRSTRRGTVHLDRDYAMLFGNPGHYLKAGDRITLVIGEQRIENLMIQ